MLDMSSIPIPGGDFGQGLDVSPYRIATRRSLDGGSDKMVMALTAARATLPETPLAAWILRGEDRLYGAGGERFNALSGLVAVGLDVTAVDP
jgi:hypothetical protein